MKKILSFLLAAVIAISLAMVPGFTSKAASYPTFAPQEQTRTLYQDAEDATTAVMVVYDITTAYKYERLYVGLYDPDGNPVANNGDNGRTFFNYTMGTRTYTLSWDISDKPAGRYTVKARMTYSSDYSNWYDVPGEVVSYVDIQKTKPAATYSNEWVNGVWYDSNGMQTYGGILGWKSNSKGWWVEDDKGWYPTDRWDKIDGSWYYFRPDGYMAANEWYNGYYFNGNGTWTYTATGSWKSNSAGWWYEDSTGWCPTSQWVQIDGAWYYFGGDGYMVTNQYVDGYWLGADGVCY